MRRGGGRKHKNEEEEEKEEEGRDKELASDATEVREDEEIGAEIGLSTAADADDEDEVAAEGRGGTKRDSRTRMTSAGVCC